MSRCEVAFVTMICMGIAAGCGVSKSEHEAVVAELAACKTTSDGLSAERAQLQSKLGEVESASKAELSATRDELEELRKQRAEMDKQLEEFQELSQKFQEMIKAEGIKVYVRRGRTIVALPSEVLFASGKAELSKRGAKTLERVAAKLRDFSDRRFIVAGHTDNVPIGQVGFADNWQLSTERALHVTRFLIEQGIKPENLAAAGYGEWDPVRTNKTSRGRLRNRRIELVIEPRLPDMKRLVELSNKLNKDDADEDQKDEKSGDQKQDANPEEKTK